MKLFNLFFSLVLIQLFMLNCVLGQDDHSWENPPPILEGSDTLFLEFNSSLGLYCTVTIEQYQTVYRIAKFFGSEPDKVFEINELPYGDPVDEGQELKVPISNKGVITEFFGRSLFKKYNKVFYKIHKGQTLYFIAHQLFDMESKVIQRRNSLDPEDIAVGQKLKIGWFPREGLFEPSESKEMEEDGISWEEIEGQFGRAAMEGKLAQDRGMAYWNPESEIGDNFFALHKSAPLNSYLEVINPMFGKKLFVKVVGRIPENTYPSEIKAVISPGAARELGAKDARFFVKMRYLQSDMSRADR